MPFLRGSAGETATVPADISMAHGVNASVRIMSQSIHPVFNVLGWELETVESHPESPQQCCEDRKVVKGKVFAIPPRLGAYHCLPVPLTLLFGYLLVNRGTCKAWMAG
jgi:hypothetical protein